MLWWWGKAGPFLCTVEYLASVLASTHWTPVAPLYYNGLEHLQTLLKFPYATLRTTGLYTEYKFCLMLLIGTVFVYDGGGRVREGKGEGEREGKKERWFIIGLSPA